AVCKCALGQLWTSWGVRPSLIVGRGIGEYVAACLAGVMNLQDALALAAKSAAQPTSLEHYAHQIQYGHPQIPVMGWMSTAADAAMATSQYWRQPLRDVHAPFHGPGELQRKNCQLVLSIGGSAASNRILRPDEMQGAENLPVVSASSWRR